MSVKNRIIVFYVILPLIIMSFALPALTILVNNPKPSQGVNIRTLASVGLMVRSSSEPYYDTHLGAYEAFDTYNDLYGDGSSNYNMPIAISQASDSSATYSMLRNYFQYKDRVQITSHGIMTTTGPSIDLAGSIDLKATTSSHWGYENGVCLTLYMSSCYSMGAGDGDIDTRFARAIKDNTAVRLVIGFSGEAELFAATFLAMNYWYAHIAGLRTPTGSFGGYNGAASFSRAQWLLESLLDDIDWTVSMTISVIVAVILGLLYGLGTAIFEGILDETFENGISQIVFNTWYNSVSSTLDGYMKMDDGEYVPSLTPVSGGGGKGGIIVTPD